MLLLLNEYRQDVEDLLIFVIDDFQNFNFTYKYYFSGIERIKIIEKCIYGK